MLNNDMLLSNRKNAYKILYLQVSVVFAVSIIWAFSHNLTSVWSTVLGGIAWLLPSFCFIRIVFMQNNNLNRSSQNLIRRFYFGELIKLLFSALLIILFIKFSPLIILPFLSGYIGAVVSCWFLPYVYKNI